MQIPILPLSRIQPRFFIPTRFALAVLALGASAVLTPARLHAADVEISASADSGDNYRLFYDKLADDGDWYQTDQYGYVFHPHAADDKAWRPYTDGYWAQTDAGWTWISNESHGWATYHYGRWANVVDTGWVWVPGADWSPGYVSWRVSKDHKRIGWAPLPPEARVERNQDIEGWVDNAYDIGPEAYVFIDTNHFGEDSYRSHLIPEDQNVTIITETDNVTRVSYRDVNSQSIVYNGGPDVAIIREATGRPVRQYQLETRPERVDYFERENQRGYNAVNGNRLTVALASPEVVRSTSIKVSQPAKINRRLSSVSVDRGFQGIKDPQAAERVRSAMRSQGAPPPPEVMKAASAALHRDGNNGAADGSKRSDAAEPNNKNSNYNKNNMPQADAGNVERNSSAGRNAVNPHSDARTKQDAVPPMLPQGASPAAGAEHPGRGRHIERNGSAPAAPTPAAENGKQGEAPTPAPEPAQHPGSGRHAQHGAAAPSTAAERPETGAPKAEGHETPASQPKHEEPKAIAPKLEPVAPRQHAEARPEAEHKAPSAGGEGKGEHRGAGGGGEKEKPSPKPE